MGRSCVVEKQAGTKKHAYTTVYKEVLYQLEQYFAAVKTDLKKADHTRRERECRYK